jgi:hypothetical protein
LHNEHPGKFPANPLDDFIWLRLKEKTPEKYANRNTRGADLGYLDFGAFIKVLEEKLYPNAHVKLAIRGHDHQEDNFKEFPKYKETSGVRLLTINALTTNRGGFGKKYNNLAIVRWDSSRSPDAPGATTVFQFEIPQTLVQSINQSEDFKSILDSKTPVSTQK